MPLDWLYSVQLWCARLCSCDITGWVVLLRSESIQGLYMYCIPPHPLYSRRKSRVSTTYFYSPPSLSLYIYLWFQSDSHCDCGAALWWNVYHCMIRFGRMNETALTFGALKSVYKALGLLIIVDLHRTHKQIPRGLKCFSDHRHIHGRIRSLKL